MKLSNKEIARVLGIDSRSVVQAKYRLKKRLNLNVEVNLNAYLKSIEEG